MIKSVKCYKLVTVCEIFNFNTVNNHAEYVDFLDLIRSNGVVVFTPPFYPNGPTRRPFTYLTTNKWFDEVISKQNMMNVLKGNGRVAKPTYRKYEIKKDSLFTEL
jgi:hypothetical protein